MTSLMLIYNWVSSLSGLHRIMKSKYNQASIVCVCVLACQHSRGFALGGINVKP